MAKKNRSVSRRASAPVPPQAPVPRQADPAFWVVLALGLLVRGAYFFSSRQSPFFEPVLLDPRYYHDWALRIARGDWTGGAGVFYGLPLYPYFLAVCYRLTDASIEAVKWIQILLGVVTLGFIYKTAEKMASRGAAIAAGVLGAVYGPLFFHEGMLISEALSLPLYAASFYFACRFAEKPSVRLGAGLGLLFGLAALTKAGILPFAFGIAAWAAFRAVRRREALLPAAAVVLTMLAAIAPVTAHNFILGRDTVLLTSHAGFNFYIGNNEEAEGVFKPPKGTGSNVEAQIEDSRAIAEKELGRTLKPSEVSKYWSGRAKEFIRNHPAQFLRLTAKKFALFFDVNEISDLNGYAFEKTLNPFLRYPWVDFGALGPLFFLGLAAALLSRARHAALALAWVSSYLAGSVAFFINARYRVPMLPAFLVLAGIGIAELQRLWAGSGRVAWRRTAFYALVLVLSVWLTRLGFVGQNVAVDLYNIGDIYLEKKDFSRALDYYRKAEGLMPDSPRIELGMGVALTGLGRPDEAKEHYLRCLAKEPNPQACNNLGLWYHARGEEDEAERLFLQAVELRPRGAQAYNNLGMVYGGRREWEKAEKMFRKSIELNPSSARAYTNLGMVLYHNGNHEEGVALWKKALEIDPNFSDAKRALELSGSAS
ncbi:MAG TPA: tetratricopeptide repeat protein [Candidatus Eisenbacteria bacterium]|nr:tetratricopeptide repeat protein [Candidatus Eisenbacteria bacterium]